MTGALLVVGLVAIASSAIATWNNWAVARKFPGLPWDLNPDIPQDIYVRITCYRLAAKLFYYQALVFWAILALLVLAHLVMPG